MDKTIKKLNTLLAKCTGLVAGFAFLMATLSTASTASFVYHQPAVPAALKKYSK